MNLTNSSIRGISDSDSPINERNELSNESSLSSVSNVTGLSNVSNIANASSISQVANLSNVSTMSAVPRVAANSNQAEFTPKLQKPPDEEESEAKLNSKRVACGLASGTITALLFNPWDKALYLSVIHQRTLFAMENWKHPFVGSGQSMVIRTISGSMFFPLKEIFDDEIKAIAEDHNTEISDTTVSFLSGNMAGVVNGITLNSINAIKYHTWTERKGFLGTINYMYKKGGLTPFLRGKSATVLRDTLFGGTYALVRNYCENILFENQSLYRNMNVDTASFMEKLLVKLVKEENTQLKNFCISFFAASIGTILSSPLNYTRNHMYGTRPGDRIPSSRELLRSLWSDANQQQEMNRIRYISMRFRLGAATARVACGMAVGQLIYDITKVYIFGLED